MIDLDVYNNYIEQLRQSNKDLKERIELLEMAVRDGLHTIHWFEGWTRKAGMHYTYRDVAKMKLSMITALGPEAAPLSTEFRCCHCNGLFDREHMVGPSCEWCQRHR